MFTNKNASILFFYNYEHDLFSLDPMDTIPKDEQGIYFFIFNTDCIIIILIIHSIQFKNEFASNFCEKL